MNAKATITEPSRSRPGWVPVVGGLIALGLALLTLRELPSLRREWRIMRM